MKNKLIKLTTLISIVVSSNIFAQDIERDGVWESHKASLKIRDKQEDKREEKENALKVLDKILSPFEDITEFALNNNLDGVKKSFKKIKNSKNRAKLEKYINQKDYTQIALLSSQIFEDEITNFKYKDIIKNQIEIENLDYMGFRLLAILKKDKIDYNNMNKVLSNSKKSWNNIKGNIKDKNRVDAFNLLFDGLELSIKNQNKDMIKILAYMDLSLVDIIENNLR